MSPSTSAQARRRGIPPQGRFPAAEGQYHSQLSGPTAWRRSRIPRRKDPRPTKIPSPQWNSCRRTGLPRKPTYRFRPMGNSTPYIPRDRWHAGIARPFNSRICCSRWPSARCLTSESPASRLRSDRATESPGLRSSTTVTRYRSIEEPVRARVSALFDCKTQPLYGIRSDPAPQRTERIKNQNDESREEVISKRLLVVKRFLDEQCPVDLCDNVL